MRHLVALAVVAGTAAVTLPLTPVDAAPPEHAVERHLHDPRLEHEIEIARGRLARAEGRSAVPTVLAEVLTADTATVARRTRMLGGEVQGIVDGALVQVRVPVTAVEVLASLDVVTDMQYPRLAGRVPEASGRPTSAPRPQATSTGVVAEQVATTNAAAWHAAGITGSGVKVGIIDYFDLDRWDALEHGPLPDSTRQFCRDSVGQGLCAIDGTIRRGLSGGDDAYVHGVAVAEVVHDMAPDAQLYLASVATTADLQAAINWFAARGVRILNRSLGSAYDGPGDGTGPLAGVVNAAARKGMVWFNSAGNDAEDAYLVRTVASTTSSGGGSYVNFNDGRLGPTPDTWLRVTSNGCFFMDGVRWANDWRLPASQRTDYAIEFWEPRTMMATSPHANPTTAQVRPIDLGDQSGTGAGRNVIDAPQARGAAPLEAPDVRVCPSVLQLDGRYSTFIRIRRNAATPVGATRDRVEVAIAGSAALEQGLSDRRGSAAKPVVDSRSPALVAVGAVDRLPQFRSVSTDPRSIAWYSSQGPTSDGRVKPDLASYSGMTSQTYAAAGQGPTFSGTSSASPTAAGIAALVLQAQLATPGAPLAALVRHFAVDRGPRGDDNAYGAGLTALPPPPSAGAAATPGHYQAAPAPTRVLDTRRATHIGPSSLVGPYRTQSVIDLKVLGTGGVPTTGVTAVALNITSVGSRTAGYVQALPTLRAAVGGTSTLNITSAGKAIANFAIVPVGSGGRISLYLQAGGDAVIDVAGWFTTAGVDPSTGVAGAGRLVPLDVPEHWASTDVVAGRTSVLARPATTAVPAGASVQALVLEVSAARSTADGYVRLFPTGSSVSAFTHSNLNFARGRPATNLAIVPVGSGGRVSMFVYGNPRDRVTLHVDVVGWITSSSAASSPDGTFVPVSPFRAFDSRDTTAFAARETRTVVVAQGPVPVTASAIAANVTVTGVAATGMLQLRPGPAPTSPVRTVTFVAGQTVAAGAVSGVVRGAAATTVNVSLQRAGHAIIDITGYFVGPPSIT
ncbi:MAG: S8 family serine peptidase [Ilumatobacteraceae bacterium]